MVRKTLAQIGKMISVENDLSAYSDIMITGVCIDTRKIIKGNLFIPFIGENADGHRFVEQAIEMGAAAALWQKGVPNPPMHLPVIIVESTLIALQELARSYRDELDIKVVGITGSNGKTTTKDMVANLLSLQYKVQKTEGNYNNHLGLPLTILGLEPNTGMAVLEMGMSGHGEIDFLTKLARPNAIIITNIGESHLLDLGSREAIADAKLEIVNGLQANGLVVYNGDEPLLQRRMEGLSKKALVKTFGRNEKNDFYPLEVIQSDQGNVFNINGVEYMFNLPVLGTHNVLNALAAMITANFFGVPFEKMNAGFASLKLTNMRMELVTGINGEKIINDAYNASPTSMQAAIELISNFPSYQEKILVLGDMLELGPQEEEFHFKIGQSLSPSNISMLFTYGRLGILIAQGAKSVFPEERVFSFMDKTELVTELKKHTREQTLILVKASRGMRLEEIVVGLQNK